MFSLNHVLKFGTTALAVLVLSACGSSGGGSSNPNASASSAQSEQNKPSTAANSTSQQPSTAAPSQPVPAENTAQQPSTSASPTTSPDQLLSAEHIGFVIPKVEDTKIKTAFINGEVANLNVLNVEGKSIDIVPAGMSSYEVLDIDSGNVTRLISGTKYKNVRWGLIDQESLKNRYLLAYGVNSTTNMPTTGQATYVGKGVHTYASNGKLVDSYKLSNAKFNVNFADKSLEGTITPADNESFGNVNEVKLSAKIDGNQFTGKTAEGTEAAGRFYGYDANELAGHYVNPQTIQLGVFGAQKQ